MPPYLLAMKESSLLWLDVFIIYIVFVNFLAYELFAAPKEKDKAKGKGRKCL